MYTKIATVLALAAVTAACSTSTDGSKAEPTDEATSDFSVRSVKIAGSLDYGQTSASTAYKASYQYVAYKFAGSEGDKLDVWAKSKNGDTVAWILDNDWHTIAKNDDASASTLDSHVTVTLPKNASATHYVVVRDYDYLAMTFTVKLDGVAAVTDYAGGCNVDADCGKVDTGCCHTGTYVPVLAAKATAYTASLSCKTNQICPMFMVKPDFSAAECNTGTHQCELVKPADITCGGFIAPAAQHQCPSGYDCTLAPGTNPDAAGKCVQRCGGIAAIQCNDASQSCVDNASDSCDPANGGADCPGVCH